MKTKMTQDLKQKSDTYLMTTAMEIMAGVMMYNLLLNVIQKL